MKTILLTLVILVSPLIFAGAFADDINLAPPQWTWYLQDPPKWHYQDDGGSDGTAQFGATIYYIQLELVYSENTLVEPNILQMEFIALISDGDEIYQYLCNFDITPGITEQVVQLQIQQYSWMENYALGELNTIPEGGGWVVIDFENSWLDVFTNVGIMRESLGKLKAGYE